MTDNEVIEILAKRDGWKALQPMKIGDCMYPQYEHPSGFRRFTSLPSYLKSKDSLQPVLEKLSEEECENLFDALAKPVFEQLGELAGGLGVRAVLTIPANQLAHAIAEAIKEAV